MDMPNEHDESDRYAVTESTLHAYLCEIDHIPLLSPEVEVALATRARAGDSEARDQPIVSNLRDVVTVARKYVGYGLPLAHLINEGNIGLIQAAKRFDPARGVKFVTYAAWWIRKAIAHALAEQAKKHLQVKVKMKALEDSLNCAWPASVCLPQHASPLANRPQPAIPSSRRPTPLGRFDPLKP
jgi:RNA polymerase primary sigma factor